jgi:hypothetical protein
MGKSNSQENQIQDKTLKSLSNRRGSSSSSLINHASNILSSVVQNATNALNYNDDHMSSEPEEKNYSNNQKNRNKIASKFPPVRHHFVINQKSTVGFCSLCNSDVKMSKGSDSNLRTHLASIHGMETVLTTGQLKKTSITDASPVSRTEKLFLDDKLLECVVRDSRTFNDFSKPGMRRFLNAIKPGYKPLGRKSIARKLKYK